MALLLHSYQLNLLDQFNSYQLPYVLIDRVTDNQQCIEADHYKGGKLQAETIIKGNAQRVLLLHQDLNYRSLKNDLMVQGLL